MHKIHIILLMSLLCGGSLAAQETLTMEQCRALALEQNKRVAAAGKMAEAARYTRRSYKANFLPDFTLDGLGAYGTLDGSLAIPGGNLPVLVPDAAGNMLPNGTYAYFPGVNLNYEMGGVYMGGVTVKQPLYMGGKIMAAYKMARLGEDMARLGKELTETEVIVATDKAYANMVKAQEMRKVAEAYHGTLGELMRNVQSAQKHGLATHNDVLKVKVKLNEAQMNLYKAGNALQLAAMNLCHYIGKPLHTPIRVSDELPRVEAGPVQTDDITARPEYKLLDKQVELNRQQVKLSRSELLPKIGIVGNYSYMNGLEINDQKVFDKGSFTAMLSVSVPVFHFGERKNKVNAAKAKLQQSLLEQSDQQELMLLQLTQAAHNLEEAQLECDLADTSLEQAEENRRVSAEQYKLGLETLSDHLEAQTLWQAAYQTQVDAHFRLYLAWIAHRQASGMLR